MLMMEDLYSCRKIHQRSIYLKRKEHRWQRSQLERRWRAMKMKKRKET
jgi:hypothetical protein